jgi:hypothetical protein
VLGANTNSVAGTVLYVGTERIADYETHSGTAVNGAITVLGPTHVY